MGTNLIRAMLLASASATIAVAAAPAAAYAQEATYQVDIPAQPMGDALRALGKATKKNILFDGSVVRGKRSVAVSGRMSASDALARMVSGSGLVVSKNSRGLVVQGGNVEGALARADSQSTASFVDVPGAPASTVVDARTGAALKGALVEIVETGEKTSTGDLGEFRFPGKTGGVNLRISYLGYPQYEQFIDLKDGRATSGILLSDGSANGEIVVTAYQSARAQALNQERTAENVSTVVSADLLGQFDGNTISDALRRVPGVAFQVDPESGDGRNIIVRGLPSDFNTVTLNGQRLPVGDGVSRSPDLRNILIDSISQITINKTLLPNQDGSGTGALVEIQTKGPLDRPSRYFNVTIEKAISGKSFLNETGSSATASFKFGREQNFGLSASIQYRKRRNDSVSLGDSGQAFFGQYLPATSAGFPVSSIDDIDPYQNFPFEPGVDEIYQRGLTIGQNSTEVENLVIGAAAQWKIADHTELLLDFNQFDSTSTIYSRSRTFIPLSGYATLPVDELGGELRRVVVWENHQRPGFNVSFSQGFSVTPTKQDTTSLTFKGKTEVSRFTFDYALGRTKGTQSALNNFGVSFRPATVGGYINLDRSYLTPDILANAVAGRVISPFAPGTDGAVKLPGLSQAGFNFINNFNSYRVGLASFNNDAGSNKRSMASVDMKYEFDFGLLKYLQTGLFFERSDNQRFGLGSVAYLPANAQLTMSDLGFTPSNGILGRIGLGSNFPVVDLAGVRSLYNQLKSGPTPQFPTSMEFPFDELTSQSGTREQDLAAYLQAHVQLGKLEIVGGFRVEDIRTRANVILSPAIFDADGNFDLAFSTANTKLISERGRDRQFLPRLTLNYRFNDNMVLRAGYYLTIARPAISQLNSGFVSIYFDPRPFYGPNGDQPYLDISLPNPSLKSATTHNFDLSVELYSDDIGSIKIGGYYKPTKNPIFNNYTAVAEDLLSNIEILDDPRFSVPNLYIQASKPTNSDSGVSLWGVEASIERRLGFLPGILGGLGIYANATYADGSTQSQAFYTYDPDFFVDFRGLQYDGSPKFSGTLALTYNKDDISGSLSYTKQASYRTIFQARGLSSNRSSLSSLDFRASYQDDFAGLKARFYFEGSNLLKSARDPSYQDYFGGEHGVPEAITRETYLGGRVFRLGVAASF